MDNLIINPNLRLPNMCDNLASMLDTKNEFIAICPPFDANQQYHVYGMVYILNDERKK